MRVGELVHATSVALNRERGVLFIGPSGAGKSALALRMMAYGAHLVSDDQVLLHADGGRLIARAPSAIRGAIEARGIGILRATSLEFARIVVVVDLAHASPRRLPDPVKCEFCGVHVPLVYGAGNDHLDIGMLQWLKEGMWGGH